MSWDDPPKRFVIACFENRYPSDPDGEGDESIFFDDIPSAKKWGNEAIRVGRFKYLALWDSSSGYWEFVDDQWSQQTKGFT